MSDVDRWLSIAAGTGLALYGLSRRKSAGWFLAAMGGMLLQRGASGHCHTYEALGINTAGTGEDTRRALGGSAGTHVDESVTINRPIQELYRFWRNLENLPQFMQHLESVERVTDTLSRWRARGPGGKIVEWNAEIINEVPNKVIGWRSIEGSDVISAGSVNFDDAGPGRGTRVTGASAVQPAGWQGRRRRGQAPRPRRRHGDPRGSAALQADGRNGRDADEQRAASRVKAQCWYGTNDVRVARVPEPRF